MIRRTNVALLLLLVLPPGANLLAGDLYTLTLSDELGATGGEAIVSVEVDFADGDAIAGYSLAVCHDALVSITAEDVTLGPGLTINPPLFLHGLLVTGEGWAVSDIVSFQPPYLLPADDLILYEVTYHLGDSPGVSALEWCTVMGDELPIATTIVTAETVEVIPEQVDGSISIALAPTTFLRGDGNNDATVDVADAIFLLNYLFSAGADPLCFDAADANGDNMVSGLLDALHLLDYLFNDGPAPPAPGPLECGSDPAEATDSLDCAAPPASCAWQSGHRTGHPGDLRA